MSDSVASSESSGAGFGTGSKVIKFDAANYGLWKIRISAMLMADDLLEVVETACAEQAMLAVCAAAATGVLAVPTVTVGGDVIDAAADVAAAAALDHSSTSKKKKKNKDDSSSSSSVKSGVLSSADAAVWRRSRKAYGLLVPCLESEQLRLIQQVAIGYAHGVWRILEENYNRKSMGRMVSLYEQLFACHMKSGERAAVYVARLTELALRLKEQGEAVSDGILMYLLLKGLPASYTSLVQVMKLSEQ
jgi:hypothetical protein